ncbi:MAG: type II toxin-antitoxin system RelE/ParE family toxin [Pseudomonadota bacterium]
MMPLNRLTFSVEAEHDLETIFEYGLAQWGVKRTRAYAVGLDRVFEQLLEFPELGPLVNADVEKITHVRRYFSGNHVVLYEIVDDALFIIRVAHQQSDWLAYLLER